MVEKRLTSVVEQVEFELLLTESGHVNETPQARIQYRSVPLSVMQNHIRNHINIY